MSPSQLAGRKEKLKVHMEEAGRDMETLPISMALEFEILDKPKTDVAAQMVGTVEQLIEAIQGYEEVGLDEIDLQMSSNDPSTFHSNMEKFHYEVMSQL